MFEDGVCSIGFDLYSHQHQEGLRRRGGGGGGGLMSGSAE